MRSFFNRFRAGGGGSEAGSGGGSGAGGDARTGAGRLEGGRKASAASSAGLSGARTGAYTRKNGGRQNQEPSGRRGNRSMKAGFARRAHRTVAAYFADAELEKAMTQDKIRDNLQLAEDVLPGLVADALLQSGSNLVEVMAVLSGHIRISVGAGQSTVVTLQKASVARQGLCFQTLDVLEQISCALEDGPDACAAVGLPAQLLNALALYFGVIISEDCSSYTLRSEEALSPDRMRLDSMEEGFMTEGDTDDEDDEASEHRRGYFMGVESPIEVYQGANGAQASPFDTMAKAQSETEGKMLRSQNFMQRLVATLCHLLPNESVLLSLLREPYHGLRILFFMVEATRARDEVTSLVKAVSESLMPAAVVERIVEDRLLARWMDEIRENPLNISSVGLLTCIVQLLVASCRSSQRMLDDYQEYGGYVLYYDVLCAVPSMTEVLLTNLRQLVYLGPGFAEAEEDAEHLGVVHSVFLARNEPAFAVVAGMLCHLEYAICAQNRQAQEKIWHHHVFAWRYMSMSENPTKSALDRYRRPIANSDLLRLPLLHCVLTIYSSNPVNFGMLDEKFGVMSTLLVSLGASLDVHEEFLFMVAKLLELISMGMDYRPASLLETICKRTLPTLVINRRVKYKKVENPLEQLEIDARATAAAEFPALLEEPPTQGPTADALAAIAGPPPPLDPETLAEVNQRISGIPFLSADQTASSSPISDPNSATSHDSSQVAAGTFIMHVLCQTLVKMIRSDEGYRAELREAGLLSQAIFPFLFLAADAPSEEDDPELFNMLSSWCSLLCDMLDGDPVNEHELRKTNAHLSLYKLILRRPTPPLLVLLQLARGDSPYLEQDVNALFEILQQQPEGWALKWEILGTLIEMMRKNHTVKDLMRRLGGFEIMMYVISGLEGKFLPEVSEEDSRQAIDVLERVFQVFTVAMTGNHLVNRAFVKEEIRYESMSSSCQIIGVFGSTYDRNLVDMVIDCITEASEIRLSRNRSQMYRMNEMIDCDTLRIRNVDPLQILTIRLSLLSEAGLGQLLTRLACMVHGDHSEQAANCEILCETWLPNLLMDELFVNILGNQEHPQHETAISLLGSLERHRSTTRSVERLLGKIFDIYNNEETTTPQDYATVVALLKVLNLAANPGNDDAFFCPYVQMSGPSDVFILADEASSSRDGGKAAPRQVAKQASHRSSVQDNAPGNLHIAGLGKRPWPPTVGYTLSFWVWLGKEAGEPIVLASIRNKEGQQLLRVTIEDGGMVRCRTCGPHSAAGTSSPRSTTIASIPAAVGAAAGLGTSMRGLDPSASSASLSSGSSTNGMGSSGQIFDELGSSSTLPELTRAALAAVTASAEASAAVSSLLGISRSSGNNSPPSPNTYHSNAGSSPRERFLQDLAPYEILFPNLNLRPGHWHHLVLVHKSVSNIGLIIDKSLNGRMTLFCDGVEVATSKFPYPTSANNGGLKTSVFMGVDPVVSATRRSSDPVRFWRLGPMLMLDIPKNDTFARDMYLLGVNYNGSMSRSCATLRDARSFTTVLLEQVFAYERGSDEADAGSVTSHLERLGLPSTSWKDLLQRNSEFLHQPGHVDLDNVICSFYAGRRTTLEGFKSIDTKSLVEKKIRELDVPRTVLVNSATTTAPGSGEQQILAVLGGGAFAVTPLPLCDTVRSVGGVTVILRLLELSPDPNVTVLTLRLLRNIIGAHEYNRFAFRQSNGHRLLAWILFGQAQRTTEIFTPEVFENMLNLAVLGEGEDALIVDPEMLHQLVLNHQVWRGSEKSGFQRWRFVIIILQWLSNLVDVDNLNVRLNLDGLQRLGIIDWVLEMILTLAIDIPNEEEIISDVLAAALQFLHNIMKQRLVRRSLFELFKHILVSLPYEVDEDEVMGPIPEDDSVPLSTPASSVDPRLRTRESDDVSSSWDVGSNPCSPRHAGDGLASPYFSSPKFGGKSTRRRRRSVTDMVKSKNKASRRLAAFTVDDEISEAGEAILRKIRCMLFALLLEIPEKIPHDSTRTAAEHRTTIYAIFSDILSVHWFTCLIRPESDTETFVLAVRLLVEILQESPDFARHFIAHGGFAMLVEGGKSHKELQSLAFSLLVLLCGIPGHLMGSPITYEGKEQSRPVITSPVLGLKPGSPSGFPSLDEHCKNVEDPSPSDDTSPSTAHSDADRISSFVSPGVKRRLLSRKSTVDAISNVDMFRTRFVEQFRNLMLSLPRFTPPRWYLDAHESLMKLLSGALVRIREHEGAPSYVQDLSAPPSNRRSLIKWKRNDVETLCNDVCSCLVVTTQRFPESVGFFETSAFIDLCSELMFTDAKTSLSKNELLEQMPGPEESALSLPDDIKSETATTEETIEEDKKRIDLDISSQQALSSDKDISSSSGKFAGPVSHGMLVFYSELLCRSVAEDSSNVPTSTTNSGPIPLTEHPLLRAKEGRKLLETFMQSFPLEAPTEDALIFQTALIQAFLPRLTLMLDDRTWEARRSAGSLMKLPHNADPNKVGTLVCFLAGRASFGWIPFAEHTILELTLQAKSRVDTLEFRERILRCARGLILWSLDVALLNHTNHLVGQLLQAVRRNYNELRTNEVISNLLKQQGSSPSDRDAYVPQTLIPEALQSEFNAYDESTLFVACFIGLCLEHLELAFTSGDEEAQQLLARNLAKAIASRQRLFLQETTMQDGFRLLVLGNSEAAIANSVPIDTEQHPSAIPSFLAWAKTRHDEGTLRARWLMQVWARIKRIELFGSHQQCGLTPPAVLASTASTFNMEFPEKRKYLHMEVEYMKRQNNKRRLSNNDLSKRAKVSPERLLMEAKTLMSTTQVEAVERHRRWLRISLEHLLRGKRVWKDVAQSYERGVHSSFFQNPAALKNPLVSREHYLLDCSDGRDRMRRRTQRNLEFINTFRFAGYLADPTQLSPEPLDMPLPPPLPGVNVDALPTPRSQTPAGRGTGEINDDEQEDEMNMVLRTLRVPRSDSKSRRPSALDSGELDHNDEEYGEEEEDNEDDDSLLESETLGRTSDKQDSASPRGARRSSADQDLEKDNEDSASIDDDLEKSEIEANIPVHEDFRFTSELEVARPSMLQKSESLRIPQSGVLPELHNQADDKEESTGPTVSTPKLPPTSPLSSKSKSSSFAQTGVKVTQPSEENVNVEEALEKGTSEQFGEAEFSEKLMPPEIDVSHSESEVVVESQVSGETDPDLHHAHVTHKRFSLEAEMNALGLDNEQRIITELDYMDQQSSENERIVNCADVSGMEASKGICLLRETSLYFISNHRAYRNPDRTAKKLYLIEELPQSERTESPTFEVTLNGEYVHILSHGDSVDLLEVPGKGVRRLLSGISSASQSGEADEAANEVPNTTYEVRKVRYDQMREMYRRRYMFCEVGIEFFSVDGANFLLVFDSPEERDWVFTKVLAKDMPHLIISKSSTMQGLAQSSLMNPEGLSLGALMAPFRRFRASVTRQWLDGEISNFSYLMYLNMLAGRSHNDLTQYPVFPWILQQYTEETIDLEDPSSYRDLSKPMGALNPDRARQFQERYSLLASTAAETQMQPFHYGTHYSCSAYVLQYLIRLEPYASMALELQGGQFDRADRLFYSFMSSWRSVSGQDFNAQDVRELIPEFFYLPEFLYNRNKFDFGTTQRGIRVDDVELPKWSENDPYYFVRLHRRALESRYVSEHLHEWVDLIFGYKQRGRAAIEAQNVFHPLTYEGEVNPDEIEDPVLKKAALAQIHNFGQTPRKLFSKPHPKRIVPHIVSGRPIGEVDIASIQWHQHLAPPLVIPGAFKRPDILEPGENGVLQHPGHCSLVKQESGFIQKHFGSIGPAQELLVWSDKVVMLLGNVTAMQPFMNHYLSWGSENGSLRLHAVPPSGGVNNVLMPGKVVAVFEALHIGPITACSVIDDGTQIWTGGTDALVSVWHLRKSKVRGGAWMLDQLQVLSSHSGQITSLATSQKQGIAVSGSRDCSAVLWDLEKKCFIRRLARQTGPVNQVSINEANGNILTLSGADLCYWHVNGEPLVTMHMTPVVSGVRLEHVKCCIATACDDFQDGITVITGHAGGGVALWDLPEGPGRRHLALRVFLQTGYNQPVTALALDKAQRRLACGNASGQLRLWTSAELYSY